MMTAGEALRILVGRTHTVVLRSGAAAQPRRLLSRWAHAWRYRQSPVLEHGRLRWYRDATTTYRLTTACLQAGLPLFARLTVEGLETIPPSGPVILAVNHLDNLDGPLLLHIVPRTTHFAARADGFGTGGLCTFWRHLCAFPADAWGMRYALTLLSEGRVVGLFVQGMISSQLQTANAAVGLLALRSGAPVIPVAISGTQTVHLHCLFTGRAEICVRFGAPVTFKRESFGASRSPAVADDVLRHIGALSD
jgi:1-acyl-sn-glycerol-3-phosphate acyltransferase